MTPGYRELESFVVDDLPPIPAAEAFVGEVLQLYAEREAEVEAWLGERRAER